MKTSSIFVLTPYLPYVISTEMLGRFQKCILKNIYRLFWENTDKFRRNCMQIEP